MKQSAIRIGKMLEVTRLCDTGTWEVEEQYLVHRRLGTLGLVMKNAVGKRADLWYIRDENGNVSVYCADELGMPRAELEREFELAKDACNELAENLERTTLEVLILVTYLHKLSELKSGIWPWVSRERISNIFKLLKEAQADFEKRAKIKP